LRPRPGKLLPKPPLRRRKLLLLSRLPLPAPDQMVTLQYPNSDVADVLHLYEQLTNKKLVMDNFVQGKVNIFISKPLPREDAIKIVEMNLLMNGYALVPAEGDVIKVIGTGRNPRGAGSTDYFG
jgi:type II secretory pathway component GspD/PulD (secretin)